MSLPTNSSWENTTGYDEEKDLVWFLPNENGSCTCDPSLSGREGCPGIGFCTFLQASLVATFAALTLWHIFSFVLLVSDKGLKRLTSPLNASFVFVCLMVVHTSLCFVRWSFALSHFHVASYPSTTVFFSVFEMLSLYSGLLCFSVTAYTWATGYYSSLYRANPERGVRACLILRTVLISWNFVFGACWFALVLANLSPEYARSLGESASPIGADVYFAIILLISQLVLMIFYMVQVLRLLNSIKALRAQLRWVTIWGTALVILMVPVVLFAVAQTFPKETLPANTLLWLMYVSVGFVNIVMEVFVSPSIPYPWRSSRDLRSGGSSSGKPKLSDSQKLAARRIDRRQRRTSKRLEVDTLDSIPQPSTSPPSDSIFTGRRDDSTSDSHMSDSS